MKPDTQPEDTQPMDLQSAKKAVRATYIYAAAVGALTLIAPFIPLFAITMALIPISFEISRHGKDNILTKSWKELKEAFSVVKADSLEKKSQKNKSPAAIESPEAPAAKTLPKTSLKESFKNKKPWARKKQPQNSGPSRKL